MGRTARKEREVARTRRDILEAAARVFAQRGYHGATMEDVATEAGFAVGSLYNYFRGKEQIYASLLQMVSEEFESLQQQPPVGSLAFQQRLEWLMRSAFALVEKHREFFVMFLTEHGDLSWALSHEALEGLRQRRRLWTDHMAALMADGIAEGVLRPLDPRDLAYFVQGSFNAAIARWISDDLPGSLGDHLPKLLDLLLRGIGTGEGVQ